MKNFLTSLLVLTLITFFSGKASAQNLKIGGGLSYATYLYGVGFSTDANFELNKQLQIAPSFTYYLETDNVDWKVLDADLHYSLVTTNGINIYALGGLSLTFVTFDLSNFGVANTTDTKFGANLGGGVSKSFGSFDLFAESKVTITDGTHVKIGAGILFGL